MKFVVPLTMPGHARDPVARQRLAQRPQQRDRARDRRLVVEVGARGVGGLGEPGPVLGEQRLVRRDDGLARLQRLQQPRAHGLDAADHLDDDVHVRPRDQRRRVRGEQLPQLGVPVRAAHGHPDQLDGRAHPGREIGGLLAQQPHDFAPDRAAPQHRDADRGSVHPPRRLRQLRLLPSPGTHRATSRRKRSSSVSRRNSTRAAPSRTATTAGRGSRLYELAIA